MPDVDVVVLGAGAAGLMCAFTAGQRGRSVLVLESSNKAGKKILMSGGGRCNFTNLAVRPECYISHNVHFCKSALARFTQWDFISMVERYGIAYHEREIGELFCNESAKDILSMLLQEAERYGVRIQTRAGVAGVVRLQSDVPNAARYRVMLAQGSVSCNSLVIATGGLSIPTLGGSDFGYRLARQFEIPVYPTRAGLVPFTFSGAIHEIAQRLTGVSVPAELRSNGHSFNRPILFTHRGLSGPAALQLSSYWQPGCHVTLDLLPGVALDQWLIERKKAAPRSRLRTQLANRLPRKLVLELQQHLFAALADTPLAHITDSQLAHLGKLINGWQITPAGTEGYRTAEVTVGGVDTHALDSSSMQSRAWPGLYFIGEVVDVTGHLGGFNFQWAWSSGYAAGAHV